MTTPTPRRTDRRQLQQLIAGLSEGIILIDCDRHILWANESALALHDVEGVDELGKTAAGYRRRYTLTYRNNHALAPAQYPIDRLLAGEVFEDVVVRVQRRGDPDSERTHRMRGRILTDAHGETDCLALMIDDVTERFTAEERFERTFNANPAPALICRLSNLRYLRVNQGFMDMTGYVREDVIDQSVYAIDVFAASTGRDLAIERLGEGRTIPQMEATLSLPDGTTKLVVVAGQPIDIGDEACMLFTFMDLEPRRTAEAALRQSEERFATAFRLSPVPTLVLDRASADILDVNDSFGSVFGYSSDDAIGRSAIALGLLGDLDLAARLDSTDGAHGIELQARAADDTPIDCLLAADGVTIHGQDCVLVVLQDISERKRSEAELLGAIEAVMRDTSWFSHTVIEKLANIRTAKHTVPDEGPSLSDLTAREQEVLALICRGQADKQIARTLSVSLHTVRNHVANVYSKVGLHKRGAVIVWARERGFPGDDPA
ncbi:helix-turn-helix transcriptional regulator [Salinisphaera sp. T31B1]|uniref:helix-turn-helix transcriptional regulator n=1 Tax=Salinisphaera sp. T31B1 TaxID=727963 RepID=UPI003341F74E